MIRRLALAAALLAALASPALALVDHLIGAPDAATLCAMLAPQRLCALDKQGAAQWDQSRVLLNIGGADDQSVRIVLSDAVWDRSDPDPRNWTITTPERLAAGFYVIVATDALDPALRDLPGNACRLIADRDAAARGQGFMIYTAADLDPALLATARVEPTFSGSAYPFGAK